MTDLQMWPPVATKNDPVISALEPADSLTTFRELKQSDAKSSLFIVAFRKGAAPPVIKYISEPHCA
jgi:hypothetical protein